MNSSQLATGARPTKTYSSSARWKRMPSPMTPPSGPTGTNCLAMFTGKLATLLMPVSEINFSASEPEMKVLNMWWDWSKSTAVSRHAFCSRRQLVNSDGTTG